MKSTFVLFLAYFAFSASAISLDDLLISQQTVDIYPVEYQGKPLLMSPKGLAPAAVCAMIGYARVVSFDTDVQTGEEIFSEQVAVVLKATAPIMVTSQDVAPKRSYRVINSVSCAK